MKIQLLTFICLTGIVFAFGQEQINNSDFENWENLGNDDEEPLQWSSLKSANTSGCGLCGLGPQVLWREGTTVHGGSYSAKIESTSFFGTDVNGLMTCGRVRAGSTTPTSTDNYNYTDTGDTEWNEAITSRPDSVAYWVNYAPSSGDQGRVSIVFHDNSDFQDPNDTASAAQIGYAKHSFSGTNGSWQRISVPVIWDAATAPAYVLATVSSSAVAGGAVSGSILYFDDLYLIYNVTPTYPTADICAGESISVDFSTTGTTTASRTFTAELSDASGSFASPTSIGNVTVNQGVSSGTISATIPGGTAAGSSYRIRVVGDHNGYSPVNDGATFTINAMPTVSIAPTATQDINVGVNGADLTATESTTATSREWKYTTTSGSGYMSFAPTETGLTYTPNFASAGTYYVICESNITSCAAVMSSEVQINVSTVGIGENEKDYISVYSFEKQLFIDLSNVTLNNPYLKLVSIDGKVVLDTKLENGSLNTMNINVPVGVYVFHILSRNGSTNGKIIIK